MRNKDIMDVKERNEGIDLLKILACFGVVILHFIGQNSGELNRIIYYAAGFSVPMFFLIHGYFILNRKTNSAKYFMHKVSKMLVIVLCWNCAFAILQLIIGHQPINPLVVSCTELFMQKGVFYQFWFFGALILLYVVTPILQYQVEKNNVILLAVLVMIAIIVDSVSMIYTYNMGKPLQEYIYQPFRIWTWILYYYMGGLIHNIKTNQPVVCMYVCVGGTCEHHYECAL